MPEPNTTNPSKAQSPAAVPPKVQVHLGTGAKPVALDFKEKTLTQKQQLEHVAKQTERISERLSFIDRVRQLGSRGERVFVLIVAAAVILYWRGLWTLYDYFFNKVWPQDVVLGGVLSVALGAGILWGSRRVIKLLK